VLLAYSLKKHIRWVYHATEVKPAACESYVRRPYLWRHLANWYRLTHWELLGLNETYTGDLDLIGWYNRTHRLRVWHSIIIIHLPRDNSANRVICIALTSCPSVCLSLYQHRRTIIMRFPQLGSTRTLVSALKTLFGNLAEILHSGALNTRWVGENCEFAAVTLSQKRYKLTPKSLRIVRE